jgi:hypothetical protein
MNKLDERIEKNLHFIVGIVIFLLIFFIGIFGIDLTLGEALLLAAFLGVCATVGTWWKEHIG